VASMVGVGYIRDLIQRDRGKPTVDATPVVFTTQRRAAISGWDPTSQACRPGFCGP